MVGPGWVRKRVRYGVCKSVREQFKQNLGKFSVPKMCRAVAKMDLPRTNFCTLDPGALDPELFQLYHMC